MDKLSDIVNKKKIINKLFIKKFIHYSLLKLYEQFLPKPKIIIDGLKSIKKSLNDENSKSNGTV